MAAGIWSRNLRTLRYSGSESASDSGSPSVSQLPAARLPQASHLSADAKLIQELDLSSRPDEALYKPNPWTIARVNAANRSTPSEANMAQASLVSTTVKAAKRPLAEAFAAQAQTKRNVLSKTSTIIKCDSRKPLRQPEGTVSHKGPEATSTPPQLAQITSDRSGRQQLAIAMVSPRSPMSLLSAALPRPISPQVLPSRFSKCYWNGLPAVSGSHRNASSVHNANWVARQPTLPSRPSSSVTPSYGTHIPAASPDPTKELGNTQRGIFGTSTIRPRDAYGAPGECTLRIGSGYSIDFRCLKERVPGPFLNVLFSPPHDVVLLPERRCSTLAPFVPMLDRLPHIGRHLVPIRLQSARPIVTPKSRIQPAAIVATGLQPDCPQFASSPFVRQYPLTLSMRMLRYSLRHLHLLLFQCLKVRRRVTPPLCAHGSPPQPPRPTIANKPSRGAQHTESGNAMHTKFCRPRTRTGQPCHRAREDRARSTVGQRQPVLSFAYLSLVPRSRKLTTSHVESLINLPLPPKKELSTCSHRIRPRMGIRPHGK